MGRETEIHIFRDSVRVSHHNWKKSLAIIFKTALDYNCCVF
jgi:hypothetical protein